MTELQVIARYTARAGQEDVVLALLAEHAKVSEAEPGCSSFVVYRQVGDDRKIVLLERYASREAFEAHRETEHFKSYVLAGVVPRLDNRVYETFDVTDTPVRSDR